MSCLCSCAGIRWWRCAVEQLHLVNLQNYWHACSDTQSVCSPLFVSDMFVFVFACLCSSVMFWPDTNTRLLTFIKAPVSQFYNLTHSLTTCTSRELNELFWKRWHKNKQNSGCRPAMINSSATDRCSALLDRRHMETIYNPTGWPSKSILTHVSFRSDQSCSW